MSAFLECNMIGTLIGTGEGGVALPPWRYEVRCGLGKNWECENLKLRFSSLFEDGVWCRPRRVRMVGKELEL